MDNIQNINIDIVNHKVYEYIYAKQWDEGRIIVFTITDNTQAIDPGNFVMFQMKKPDGHVILYACPIEDGKAKVIMSRQMSACAGKIPYQLNIYSSAQPIPEPGEPVDPSVYSGGLISTVTGYMIVEESVVQPDDVESSEEFNVISDMAQTLGEIADILANDGQAIIDAANDSIEYAKRSKSYAVGGTDYSHEGIDDDIDNSKYYFEQTQKIYNTCFAGREIELPVSGWDSSSLTQIISVPDIIEDEAHQFVLINPLEQSRQEYADCGVMLYHQDDNILAFKCSTLPTHDLYANILIQMTNMFNGVITSNIIYSNTEPSPLDGKKNDYWCCSYD